MLRLSQNKYLGFTIIEFIFVITLISIISVVVSQILLQGYRSYLTSQHINNADWQALMVLDRFANDIHMIRSTHNITLLQPTQFTFQDVNGNTNTYALSGSTLTRNGQTIATGVQSLTFTYLNSLGASTSTATNIAYVAISLTLAQSTLSATYTTMAGVRNK